MVLDTRLELVRMLLRGILSPLCLPIPPIQQMSGAHLKVLTLSKWAKQLQPVVLLQTSWAVQPLTI